MVQQIDTIRVDPFSPFAQREPVREEEELIDTEEYIDEIVARFHRYIMRTFYQHIPPPERPIVRALYLLGKVENDEYQIFLKKPLVLELEKDGDVYIFFHEVSHVMGTGSTQYEALRDFENAFIQVYFSYKNTPREQLTDKALEYFHSLERLIERYENIQQQGV